MATIKQVETVQAGADDAQELDNVSGFAGTGTTISVISSTNSSVRLDMGFRFSGSRLPQGATVTAATIAIWTNGTKNTQLLCHIYGENVDNAASYTTTAHVANRTKTTANVAWSDATSYSAGSLYATSPDISTVVQEVLNRGSWAPGNAINIILFGDNSATSRTFTTDAFENGTNKYGILSVTYTVAGGAETAAGADATKTLTAAVTSSDTAAAADTNSALTARPSSSDTAASADTGSVAARPTGSDTAVAADTNVSLAVAASAAETGSAADSALRVVLGAQADTGAASEAQAGISLSTQTDTASSDEALVALGVPVAGGDAAVAIDEDAGYRFVLGPQREFPTPMVKPPHNADQRVANRLHRYFRSGVVEEANLYLLDDDTLTDRQPVDTSRIVKVWYGGHTNVLTGEEQSLLIAAGYEVERVEV